MAISSRSALLAALLVWQCLVADIAAWGDETDVRSGFFVAGNGAVTTIRDEKTASYQMTMLSIGTPDRREGTVTFLHDDEGNFALLYRSVSSDARDGGLIEITVSIDLDYAATVYGYWSNPIAVRQLGNNDDFLDELVAAQLITYRVGAGTIMTVPIPERIDELVDEFRRRVDEQQGAGV